MKRIINATIRLDKSNDLQIAEVKQGDSITMNLSLTDGGNWVRLNDITDIQLAVERPDKKSVVLQTEDIRIDNNTVVIDVGINCVSMSGLNRFELILMSSEGTVRTGDFFVLIKPKIFNDKSESYKNYIAEIERLIDFYDKKLNDMETGYRQEIDDLTISVENILELAYDENAIAILTGNKFDNVTISTNLNTGENTLHFYANGKEVKQNIIRIGILSSKSRQNPFFYATTLP